MSNFVPLFDMKEEKKNTKKCCAEDGKSKNKVFLCTYIYERLYISFMRQTIITEWSPE